MSLRRTRTRPRTLAAVGFLAAAGLFLTACGPDAADTGSGADSGASASVSPDSSVTPGSSSSPSEGTVPDGDAPSSAGATPGSGGATEAGADGTFTGRLTYLAPGKLLVGDRAFWVAEDTVIEGGDICGDPETQGAEKCTGDELDGAAKDGNLTVEVTIEKGIAGRVTQV